MVRPPLEQCAYDLAESVFLLKEKIGCSSLHTHIIESMKDRLSIAARMLMTIESELRAKGL